MLLYYSLSNVAVSLLELTRELFTYTGFSVLTWDVAVCGNVVRAFVVLAN